MAKVQYQLFCAVGTYKGKDGQDKTRFIQLGSAWIEDGQKLSIKLESLPATGFNGWINASVYDPNRFQQKEETIYQKPKATPSSPDDFLSGVDIVNPFE